MVTKSRLEYVISSAQLDAARLITARMVASGVTQEELAVRMHTSPARVSVLLSGRNMTVRTLARALYVLGSYLELKIV